MRSLLFASLLAVAVPAAAQTPYRVDLSSPSDDWADQARFFGGVRTGVAIPAGGRGVAPSLGFELGVSAQKGVGFGLHLLAMNNPPAIPQLQIPKAQWGIGALADLRMYIQTIEPLSLYGTLAGGFVAGPGEDGMNAVLPMVNPGFGARVKLSEEMYVAFEFGAAGFFIPFVNISAGWEPTRRRPVRYEPPPGPPPAAAPAPTAPPPPTPVES
jgi:hypothetical protein